MANRSYLTVTDHSRIYPSFGDLPFDVDEHTALMGVYCVPLLWIPLFSAGDLVTHQFEVDVDGDVQTVEATAPLVDARTARDRLQARRGFLNALFAGNGGVDHHLDMLLVHLDTYAGRWLSVEYEEIQALSDPDRFNEVVAETLGQLDADNPDCIVGLAELSDIDLGVRFVTPETEEGPTDAEARAYFQLLGGTWGRDAPWD